MISRDTAVAIAASWRGTPYVLGARVKGAGCDCATFLAGVLLEWGVAKPIDFDDVGLYQHDWFAHTRSDRYLLHLMRHAPKTLETICRAKVTAALPGSLVLFKSVRSRVFNHGGIVTKWPMMLHATQSGVVDTNATNNFLTSQREMAIFDPWSSQC